MILLVELTGYTDASTAVVYRYSTGAYITQPGDTPSSAWYDPRVLNPGSYSTKAFADGEDAMDNPGADVGAGEITLANVDGTLDSVFGSGAVSFRERQVRVLGVEPGAAYSTAVLLLQAVIAQPQLSRDEVSIAIKDPRYLLDSAHQTTTYAGNNALPAGVEGVADLLGKVKPMLYGKGLKIAPPCNNTSKLIHQISTRALVSVDGVWDGGSALTAGTAYTDQADMEANAPSAGQYRAWLAGGMIRLGSSPAYGITVDATADSAGNSTAAQLIKRLALDRGWSSGDISAGDVTALDALNSAVCGVWINDDRTTLAAMDLLARSVGAAYWVSRLGVLRMARIDLPTGAAADVVANWKAASVTQVQNGQDVPVGTVRLRYARYEQPQRRSELSGSVSDADASDLAEQWRVATYSATPSPNPHKRLRTIDRETALTSKTDADAEAQRLQELFAGPRRTHECTDVFLDSTSLLALDIDAKLDLRWNRYGFDPVTGTLRLVGGMNVFLRDLRCDLTLWGP